MFNLIIAICFPPLLVLLKAPESLIPNIILTVLGWVPGVIHALVVAERKRSEHKFNKKLRKQSEIISQLQQQQIQTQLDNQQG